MIKQRNVLLGWAMSGIYNGLTDNDLVRRIQDQEFDAFAELAVRYQKTIKAKADLFRKFTAPEKDDLCQEGYMGLFVAAKTYNESRNVSFKTYAAVCIQNGMISAARRYGSRGNHVLNSSVSLDEEEVSEADNSTPEAMIESREKLAETLRQIDMHLSKLERLVLSHYLNGIKREQVTEITGMSLRSFDNALHRVRKKLREL